MRTGRISVVMTISQNIGYADASYSLSYSHSIGGFFSKVKEIFPKCGILGL